MKKARVHELEPESYYANKLHKDRMLRVDSEGIPLIIQYCNYLYSTANDLEVNIIYLFNGLQIQFVCPLGWFREYFTDWYNKKYKTKLSVEEVVHTYA